jgi:hypothetical protein
MKLRMRSRGHLYSAAARPAIRVSLVIALFAVAYAVLVLAMGVVPLNRLLDRFLSDSVMQHLWRESMLRLAERTVVATIACWIGLALSGRSRGRLTGPGMIALGAAMSGALAGALDVGVQHFWVRHLVAASARAPLLGQAMSAAITATIALLVTLLLITRNTTTAAQ